MKNYNEMAQSVLTRINNYETAKRHKKTVIIRTAVTVFCLCAVGIAGFAIQNAGAKSTVSTPEKIGHSGEESVISKTQSGESGGSDGKKLAFAPSDALGAVIIDGTEYVQDYSDYAIEETFTADKCLGDARDYNGTYKNGDGNISAEIYTVKESENVLLVKLGNGGEAVLIRNGELSVGGKDYYFYGTEIHAEKTEKCLGKAKPYIIDVPVRENNIGPDDEIWTVKGDGDKLIAVKNDGTKALYYASGTTFTNHGRID